MSAAESHLLAVWPGFFGVYLVLRSQILSCSLCHIGDR